MTRLFIAAVSSLCLSLAPTLVHAAADGELEEIVVTATLRSQPQIDYAGSATVLDAGTLRAAGQRNLEDILALVPNLNWAGDTSLPRYFQIRGIGELQQYQGAPNPSVGVLIDDIDFSGLGGAATLFDIDQIEVLHGPQATLYGANALAGLIYVRSAAPAGEFGGRIELQAGDYGTRTYGAVLTGPVPDLDSGFRLAVQRYTSDGYYSNAYLHSNTDHRDELTVRGRWRYQPVDDLRIDLSVLRVQINNGYDQWTLDGSRTTRSDQPGVDVQYSTGASARATWTGWRAATVTAIATHALSDINYSYDGDWGSPPLWTPYTYQYSEAQLRHRTSDSLELRVASPPASQGFGWLVGAYAAQLREKLTDASAGLYVDPFDASQNSSNLTILQSQYRARNGALYGQLDGDLGARTRWSLGVRGERRTTDYADNTPNVFGPADTLWGGHASLDFALDPHQHLYALVARGYKAGGFNLSQGLTANQITFARESDLNLEVGDKFQSADGTLHLDTALFYMVRKAPQLLTGTQQDPYNPDYFVYYTGTARSGYNAGLESSLEWQATHSLTLGGSLSLLATQYRGFVQNGVLLPAREQPHAPPWQAAVHAAWQGASGAFARIDVTGMGAFYYDMPPNPTTSTRYGLVNLKGGWRSSRVEIAGWMRNALNHDYTVRGFYFGNQPPDFQNQLFTQLGDPRNSGVQLSVSF